MNKSELARVIRLLGRIRRRGDPKLREIYRYAGRHRAEFYIRALEDDRLEEYHAERGRE